VPVPRIDGCGKILRGICSQLYSRSQITLARVKNLSKQLKVG